MVIKKYDVTALGEILIDFTYAGKSERGTALFEQNPGGAPANVLSAVAKLGGQAAFIGKIGKDMHGEFLKQTLVENGIEVKGLVETDDAFTTLAFVALDSRGERSFSFARKPGADTGLSASEVDFKLIEESRIFHIGSLSLTDEPAKSATVAALRYAKEQGMIISYDPNYRAALWKSRDAAIEGMKLPLAYADIIKISDEETELLTGERSETAAAKKLMETGISCVIVTMGAKGAYVAVKNASVYSEAIPAAVVDTTGAGDAFMGGFLYRVAKSGKMPCELNEGDIVDFSRFANATAAYCIGRRGGINAMPSMCDVEEILGK